MTEREVFGIPIRGDIQAQRRLPEQDDPRKFIDALNELLAHPEVKAVRWNQHTPSWNDGERCEFGVNGPEVNVGMVADEDGEYGDMEIYAEPGEEFYLSKWDMYTLPRNEDGSVNYERRVNALEGRDGLGIMREIEKFETVLDSGKHFTFLMTSFGDPAEVTATSEGFDVEYYDGE